MENMENKKINGFEFSYNDLSCEGVENIPYQVMIINKKTQFKKGIEYIKENDIKKLELNIELTQDDLEQIAQLPILGISIKNHKNELDINIINKMRSLEYLSLQGNFEGQLNFEYLNKIMYLDFSSKEIKFNKIEEAKNIKQIVLYDYKGVSVQSINSSSLENIQIYNSDIETLDFIQDSKCLKKVEIENCKNLTSIYSLRASSLTIKELALRNCKKLTDYSVISNLQNIEIIYLLNCGDLKNADIFQNLKNLKYGSININIEDGNVDEIINLPIIFKNYSHFNHKNILKIKIVTNDGNYLMRGKDILYKL